MWQRLFFILVSIFIIWLIYRVIRYHPKALSRENLGKSFYTLGWLALALIAFVGLLVLLLRS